MIEIPAVRKKVYKTYLRELVVSSEDRQAELQNDQYFNMVDWSDVKKLIGNDKLVTQIQEIENEIREDSGVYDSVSSTEMDGEARYRVLRMLKGLYYEQFEHGFAEEDTCRLLVESSDISLDQTSQGLNIWELLYFSFTSLTSLQYFFRLVDYPIIGRFAQDSITRHLGFIYDVTTTFITCSKEAVSSQDHIPLNRSAVKKVMEELECETEKAEAYLSDLNQTFPEIIRAIQTKRAAHTLLMNQQLQLDESHENGLVDESEYKTLKSDLVQRLVSLESHVFEWSAPSFDRFVIEFPMFATLTKSEREKIKLGAVEKKYYKDEIIYEKNMTCQYIYIIMRGRGLGEKNSDKGDVREELSEDVHVKKGLGAILSFANIIGDESGKCLSQAVALNDCVFTAIKVSILKDLMADNPDFEAKIYLSATGRSVRR